MFYALCICVPAWTPMVLLLSLAHEEINEYMMSFPSSFLHRGDWLLHWLCKYLSKPKSHSLFLNISLFPLSAFFSHPFLSLFFPSLVLHCNILVILAVRVLAWWEQIVFGMFAVALLFTEVSVHCTNSFTLSRHSVSSYNTNS